jgi:hypothetical protein
VLWNERRSSRTRLHDFAFLSGNLPEFPEAPLGFQARRWTLRNDGESYAKPAVSVMQHHHPTFPQHIFPGPYLMTLISLALHLWLLLHSM